MKISKKLLNIITNDTMDYESYNHYVEEQVMNDSNVQDMYWLCQKWADENGYEIMVLSVMNTYFQAFIEFDMSEGLRGCATEGRWWRCKHIIDGESRRQAFIDACEWIIEKDNN